jgi:hypothetical protein
MSFIKYSVVCVADINKNEFDQCRDSTTVSSKFFQYFETINTETKRHNKPIYAFCVW